METKFTPEPWLTSYKKQSDGMYSQVVYDKSEENICELAWYPVNEGIVVIDDIERESIRTNRKENANLIAAAPEMYEMLDELTGILSQDAAHVREAYISYIEKLLAKARGEQ